MSAWGGSRAVVVRAYQGIRQRSSDNRPVVSSHFGWLPNGKTIGLGGGGQRRIVRNLVATGSKIGATAPSKDLLTQTRVLLAAQHIENERLAGAA
jgi:hypothetical protein